MLLDRVDAGIDFVNTTHEPLNYSVLASSNNSAIGSAGHQVVRDEAAFASLWTQHNANLTPAPALPSVDFAHAMVVAVFGGNKPSGCYGSDVVNVYRSLGRVYVVVRNSVPGADRICTQAISASAQFIVLDRTNDELVFVDEEVHS